MGRGRPLEGKPAEAPACSCGAKGSKGHARECALVAYALGRTQEPQEAEDALGRTKGKPKTGETRDGVWFASKLEADVFDELRRLVGNHRGVIIRQPRFDLWASWRPGMGKPLAYTPDFLEVWGSGSSENPWRLRVHEAKGPRKLESRDYRPRLAAFRASYPWLPVVVWRRHGLGLARQPLADLEDTDERLDP